MLVDAPLSIDPGVLKLEVDIVGTEDAGERVQFATRTVKVVVHQAGADGARQAARQHDDALGVPAHKFVVDSRTAVVALEVPGRAQADEVVIAGGVLCQQGQVVALFLAPEAVIGHDVGLEPHDGRDAALGRLAVQLHRAAHHAVVGERHCALPEFLHAIKQARDLAGAIEDRIIRVDMEVRERWAGTHPTNLPTRPDGARATHFCHGD